MKKINKSKILILGLLLYLLFNLGVSLISKNVDFLQLKPVHVDLKKKYKGKFEIDSNNGNTYFNIHVKGTDLNMFEDDKKLKMTSDNISYDAIVYKKYENLEENLVRLKIIDENVVNYSTREREFDIIYRQMDCFRIPKTSIKNKDNKQGVFVVDEEYQKSRFEYLENIICEDENFVYIDHYKNEEEDLDTVSLHDRIILKPNYINTNIRIK